MRNTVKRVSEKVGTQKSPLEKRMIVNRIRPGLTRAGLTDDGVLRFVVTKTYVEEGKPMNIIEDDFLHFAIRGGEIWMEPQNEFVRRRPKRTAPNKKSKKTAAAKKTARKK
jgi:hypothetical protein